VDRGAAEGAGAVAPHPAITANRGMLNVFRP